MLPELAKDYSNYMKINVAQEISPIQDVVDDLLTRLEETESIIAMIHLEQEQEDILPDLIQCNENLKRMEVKVDKITAFLAHVARDVNMLQTKVINAELDFPVQTNEGSLSSLFNKLIKSTDSSVTNTPRSTLLPYEAPEIFRTSEFFPPVSQPSEGESSKPESESATKTSDSTADSKKTDG
uniref:Biogenesis of lysosome-related organelles complex 1 subunit 4 n=1 Tax=Cacopsylla melanoneura TaxID=428564 RepID=A0A8D9DWK8_9HEMI